MKNIVLIEKKVQISLVKHHSKFCRTENSSLLLYLLSAPFVL